MRPLKLVIDFIEETQTEWLNCNGYRDINGTKYCHTPPAIYESLKSALKAEPNNTGPHICVVDVPAYQDFVFVVMRFPKRGVRR